MDSSYLRGDRRHADEATTTTTTTALQRHLYEENSSSNSNNADDKSFAIMLTVLVALILVFFVVGMYHVLRLWLCKCLCGRDLTSTNAASNAAAAASSSSGSGAATMLVHDGRVFNLTGHQRRAVLEAIFSETSKVRLHYYVWICERG